MVGIDRQRRVQVQAAGHGRRGLIRTDGPQPLRVAAPGEVQAGARPVCISTVSCARIRRSVRSRGSRMLSDRHRAAGGLVDQPVMSLDQGCSVGGAGDGAHRRLCQMARHLRRSGACVAQRRPAELVVRPGPGVERRRPPPAARCYRCGHREACAPRRFQRVHVHRLARFGRRVRADPRVRAQDITYIPVTTALSAPWFASSWTGPADRGDSRGGCSKVADRPMRPGPARV